MGNIVSLPCNPCDCLSKSLDVILRLCNLVRERAAEHRNNANTPQSPSQSPNPIAIHNPNATHTSDVPSSSSEHNHSQLVHNMAVATEPQSDCRIFVTDTEGHIRTILFAADKVELTNVKCAMAV